MRITNRKIKCLVIILCALIFFASSGYCEGADKKEDLETYLKEIASIMTNVDNTIRTIEFNTLPMKEGIRYMDTYIGQARLIEHPNALSKQYTMIMLSFKKLRTGLFLFSSGKRDIAIGLIKNGTRLLKYAAKDIIAIAEKEGIRKSDKPAEKGEPLK